MLREVMLKTERMFDENDLEDADYELWKSIAEFMNGEKALIIESNAEDGDYVFLGLTDREKDKELFYMMEQDGMTGVYINDRQGFNEIWESGEYDHEGCFYLEPKYFEAVN